MKKKLLLALPVIAGVAGASWAGSTLYSSNESRAAYERILSDLTESTGLSFVTASYAPGFLESTAITEIRLSDEPDAELVARLQHNIEHSPAGSSAASGFSATRVITTFITDDLSSEYQQDIVNAFGANAPVTMLSSVGFNGIVSNELTVAPFEFGSDSELKFSTDGGVWNFDVDETGSVAGTGSWSGLQLTSTDMSITVAPSNDIYNYKRLGPAIYSGEYKLDLPEVVFNSPSTGMSVGARGLGMSGKTDIQNGLLATEYAFWFDDLDAPVALDSAKFTSSVGGIDITKIEKVRDVAVKAHVGGLTLDDDDALTALAQEYISAYGDMIQPGAFLSYGLTVGNAGGEAEADVKLTFEGDGTPTGTGLLVSPNAVVADLLRAIRVDANVDASGDALALTPLAMMVDPASLAPWVVDEAGNLKSRIVLDDLYVDANGESMSLEMMLGEAMYEPLDLNMLQSM